MIVPTATLGRKGSREKSEKSGHPPGILTGILGIEISVIKINTLAASGCGGARLHRIFRENK